MAETCPNVFCDPAWQESLWERQLRLALDRLEIAQGDLKKAKTKGNVEEVEAAKKEIEAAKKEIEAAKKEVAAAKKEVAAGPAQARSACT